MRSQTEIRQQITSTIIDALATAIFRLGESLTEDGRETVRRKQPTSSPPWP